MVQCSVHELAWQCGSKTLAHIIFRCLRLLIGCRCQSIAQIVTHGTLVTHTFTSCHIIVFFRMVVTFSSYITDTCHSCSGVATRLQPIT